MNISSLVNFHIAKGKVATVTAVRPIPRFGALEIENDMVQSFPKRSGKRRVDKWRFLCI